jgi:glycosyltransferase involved in cell wall biosynthesis
MKIVIDARLYGHRHGGLGRYVQQLVLRLPKLDSSAEWVLLMGEEAEKDYRADVSSIPQNVTLIRAPWRWYTLAEQIHMPRLIRKLKPDLTHYPHFNVPMNAAQPFVVTIHDLIINHFPSSRATTLNPISYSLKLWAYRAVVNRALCRARKILVPTKFVADDIQKVYPWVDASKVIATYEGAAVGAQNFAPVQNGIREPFILYVGSAYPHKDVMTALRAFAELKRRGIVQTFVHVWRPDIFLTRLQEQARRENLTDGVVWTGYLPDDQLVGLYQNAAAYVFPSLYEGFGLPSLEAQMHGCPVVAARASCLPEILADTAAWFEPGNAEDMARVVQSVIQDSSVRQNLVQKGNENWKKFSWDRTAEQTLAQYTSVDK